MCGRYSLASPPGKIRLVMPISPDEPLPSLQLRFNIAPTQNAAVVLPGGKLSEMRWGLAREWAGPGQVLINLRSETALEKPRFKRLLASQRCLVPADGFYEWKRAGSQKQPYRFRLKSGEPFGFAGFWDRSELEPASFVILTTRPNEVVGEYHNRMPVILGPSACAQWLASGELDVGDFKNCCEPLPAKQVDCYPVTPRVNRAEFDCPECVEPFRMEQNRDVSQNLELGLGL